MPGVVISASHNPFEYNGIKFFNGEGYKLSDSVEEKIEELILDTEGWGIELPIGGDIGHCTRAEHAADDYIKFATGAIDCKLDGLRLLADCSNGANSAIAPRAFSELGAYVECLSVEPDGVNINKDCGSTHIDKLEKQIAESGKFDVGIAFDGDADRMLAVDETGKASDRRRNYAHCGQILKGKRKARKGYHYRHRYEQSRLLLGGGKTWHQDRPDGGRRPVCTRRNAQKRVCARRRRIGPYYFLRP